MAALSKRLRLIKNQVEGKKEYSVADAMQLFKGLPSLKFVESVEVSVYLNINTKKSDQTVRGVTVLPHGTGRKARVIVFTQAKEQMEAAMEAGAYRVGFEELVSEIKQEELLLNERDILVATPAAMRLLVPLGPILGPRGLMPNPKLGTVTENPVAAVREALLGRVQYRNDKGGVARCLIGKLSFGVQAIQENLQTLIVSLLKNKPSSAPKGNSFIKKVALSSTMGPQLMIDKASLVIEAVS